MEQEVRTDTVTKAAKKAAKPKNGFRRSTAAQQPGWSASKLSRELRLDRRTVGRHLEGVPPIAQGTHGPLYSLADAVRTIFGATALSELDRLRARQLKARAEAAEIDVAKSKSELVSRAEVEAAATEVARVERKAWELWPDRVAPLIGAEFGIDQKRLALALERHVRDHLEERANGG